MGKKKSGDEVFQYLQCIADAMKSNQHRYFDMNVYMALSRFDKKYRFFGLRKRIKLCKGALWYGVAEKFGMR